MYRTIVRFIDLKDDKHVYEVGDEFPRKDLMVSKSRLEELSTDKNKRGIPLIELVEDVKVEDEEVKEEVEEVKKPKIKTRKRRG